MKFLVVSVFFASAVALMVHAAPAGVALNPTHHVFIGVHDDDDDDDHSLEDIHDDSLEDHLDRLRYMKHPHDVILDDHLDRVEDILEDHYGVDLDNLFEDDHHRLHRVKYVVRPGVYTHLHELPGASAIFRKYFSIPYSTRTSHVVRPTAVVTAATSSTPPIKKVLVGNTKSATVSVSTNDPAIPAEVVKKIVDEEVKDAVEDIAENPRIDVQEKAKEVVKEIVEETKEFKENALKSAKGISVDDDTDKDGNRPIRTL